VLVVTPNLCFDRTLWLDTFAVGTVSRPRRVSVTAGGKGVNVARTLRDLGHAPRLVGLLPRDRGADLLGLLEAEGADVRPVLVPGAVRSATIVLERSGRATVLNEPGPELGAAELELLLHAVDEELASLPAPVVTVCSGSLPPGLPHDTYGRITDLVHARGGVVVVDAARESLAATLRHSPDLVTPNLDEARGLLDGRTSELSHHHEDLASSRAAAFTAAHALRVLGARQAVVTVGAHGVARVDADGQEHWDDAHEVAAINPIGAGDSFVAGVVAWLEAHPDDWAGAGRYAVAVAGAAVEQPIAGHVDAARVASLAGPIGAPADVAEEVAP
jgi:1-phosphofructokinase family hexose kinase